MGIVLIVYYIEKVDKLKLYISMKTLISNTKSNLSRF